VKFLNKISCQFFLILEHCLTYQSLAANSDKFDTIKGVTMFKLKGSNIFVLASVSSGLLLRPNWLCWWLKY